MSGIPTPTLAAPVAPEQTTAPANEAEGQPQLGSHGDVDEGGDEPENDDTSDGEGPVTWLDVSGIGYIFDNYGDMGNFNEPDGVFPTVTYGMLYRDSEDAHLMGRWRSNTLVPSELSMMWFMNSITDKPEWSRKIHDEQILSKWRAELDSFVTKAKAIPASNYSYPETPLQSGFSNKMWEYCISELKDKAKVLDQTGAVSVFDGGAAVIKADGLVRSDVKSMLRTAAAKFEDVPDSEKDWHPNSDDLVLDLVHPSLFPLVYYKTRIVKDEPLNLSNALEAYGSGEVIDLPVSDDFESQNREPSLLWWKMTPGDFFSERFQWLPAEIKFSARTGEVKIDSYINNAHPVQHADLYPAVEGVLKAALPLFRAVHERSLSFPSLEDRMSRTRVPCMDADGWELRHDYVPGHNAEVTLEPRGMDETQDEFVSRIEEATNIRVGSDEDIEGWLEALRDGRLSWWGLMNKSDWHWWAYGGDDRMQPPPREYAFSGITAEDMSMTKNDEHEPFRLQELTGDDREGNLQVIVKLANIHLTPEKPSYDGGTWHVEGLRNESICATALYYYDNENVTASTLSFRTGVDAEDLRENFQYEQGDRSAMVQLYDGYVFSAEWGATQELGRAATVEDRLLVFPNVYQHKVSSFELVDKTKPGHRKILALFLVDPATRIVSTQHVPPQQLGWASLPGVDGRLPPEVASMVEEELGCPYSLDEAKELRLELMEERTATNDDINEGIAQEVEFNFCEH